MFFAYCIAKLVHFLAKKTAWELCATWYGRDPISEIFQIINPSDNNQLFDISCYPAQSTTFLSLPEILVT